MASEGGHCGPGPETPSRRARAADLAGNEYHFVTHWRVAGTAQEVSEVLSAPLDLVRWWPAVYLAVEQRAAGDADGIGAEFALLTKGWLPYHLRWSFRVTESQAPQGFALEATGDFAGRGVWTFRQEAGQVAIRYDWTIRADKRLLRWLSPLLRPVFAANHRWAMRTCEESLRLELARRCASSEAERAALPAPPGPTGWSPLAIAGGALRRVERALGRAEGV